MITQKELKEILHYDENTGVFTWLKSHDYRIIVGEEAGFITGGYKRISYKNIKYPVSRLAWFYMTGKWPKKLIDHKDRVKTNNKWSNLRECTPAQNNANQGAQKNSTTGYKGVCLDRRKYRADITFNKKLLFLGFYATAKEAAQAYNTKALELYGDFAYLNEFKD